jgi:hypothetical protein
VLVIAAPRAGMPQKFHHFNPPARLTNLTRNHQLLTTAPKRPLSQPGIRDHQYVTTTVCRQIRRPKSRRMLSSPGSENGHLLLPSQLSSPSSHPSSHLYLQFLSYLAKAFFLLSTPNIFIHAWQTLHTIRSAAVIGPKAAPLKLSSGEQIWTPQF